jgi:hypothetical protein
VRRRPVRRMLIGLVFVGLLFVVVPLVTPLITAN